MDYINGQIPEWPKGTDCKSAANCFGGSNPPLPILAYLFMLNARVAEQADAQDLKSCCGNTVPVRFRSPAFCKGESFLQSIIVYACVAQLDRASGYGPEGRGFESCRTQYEKDYLTRVLVRFFCTLEGGKIDDKKRIFGTTRRCFGR